MLLRWAPRPRHGPKRGYGGVAILARGVLPDIALLEYVDDAERMADEFIRRAAIRSDGNIVDCVLCAQDSIF